MSGLDEKGLEAARAAFYGPKGSVVAAISAYLAAATPADVGELVERLRSAGCHYGIPIERDCAEAATALERVTRERDEWERRAGDAIMGEAAAIERAESAEAKLAEARKVIEAVAYLQQTYAGEISPPSIETVRAARRFLEETK